MWVITADPEQKQQSNILSWGFHAYISKSTENFHRVLVATVFLCITSTSALGLWWRWLSQTITGSSGDQLSFRYCSHSFQGELLGERMETLGLYWHSVSENFFCTLLSCINVFTLFQKIQVILCAAVCIVLHLSCIRQVHLSRRPIFSVLKTTKIYETLKKYELFLQIL